MRVFKTSHVCLATVKWLSSNRKPPCFRKCSQTNPSCIRQWKGCPFHNHLINGCADKTAGFSPRTGPRHSRQTIEPVSVSLAVSLPLSLPLLFVSFYFVVVCFVLFIVLFLFAKLFCIGCLCIFIVIQLVTGQVAFYNKTFRVLSCIGPHGLILSLLD